MILVGLRGVGADGRRRGRGRGVRSLRRRFHRGRRPLRRCPSGRPTRLRARPTVLEGRRELRPRRAGGHHTQSFLPVFRRDRYGCQRLRRVPLVCLLGRRAFLRCQTTTELLASSASVTTPTMATTTTAGDAQSTAFSPNGVVIGEQCSAHRAAALNFFSVSLRRGTRWT